ncbi:MAG: HAMP domain-containing histidine kinase [Patescibacteria group bacterium]|nr:HAMP domain-containing histidine kinase [Patescibacteria group bacterium]
MLATYGGYVLIKSVKAEIKQKEDLERLAKKLDEANQHLEELDETKDNFLSMASHELNTPIAAIEGYLSMIIDEKMAGELNPKAKEYLTNVYNSSKRLAALVKDLLNVSRIESNRVHIIYTETQIEDVIDQAFAEIKMKAKEAGHTLTFEKPKNKLPKTFLDVPRIIEVMINFMGNAIKYTDPPGKIVVKCHADDDKIVVSVEDNGRGIPKDKYEHMFEKFTQVNVFKDEVKGTGLGMFISKNLIELHKGKIWFKSSVDAKDHGTTFYFSIPILKKKPFDPNEGEGALFQTPRRQGSAGQAGKKATTNDTSQEKTPEAEKPQEDKVTDTAENKTESVEIPESNSPAKEEETGKSTDSKDISITNVN